MIIDHRDYYNRGKIEAIDAIESACTGLDGYEGFLTGTCLKYLFRWRWKGTAQAGRSPATPLRDGRGKDTNAIRKWEKTGRIPPYARQKLVMRWPERFHDIEFSPEASV